VVVMNVAMSLDIAPCSPYANRHFGRTYRLHLQGRKSAEEETSMQQVARHCLVSFSLDNLILRRREKICALVMYTK
jgi:hypothetical protein